LAPLPPPLLLLPPPPRRFAACLPAASMAQRAISGAVRPPL
jgi:hypothetical protein